MLALEFIIEAVAWLITFAKTIFYPCSLVLNELQMNGTSYTFISAQKKDVSVFIITQFNAKIGHSSHENILIVTQQNQFREGVRVY